MTTRTPTERLPAEFVGMARDFRRRVSTADDAFRVPMRQRILASKPLWQTTQNHTIRPQTLQRLVTHWQQEPLGRLRLECKLHKSDLFVSDYRLTTGTTQFYSWQDDELEPSVTVELVSFECSRQKFLYEFNCIALLSLHAIARRFQRCSTTDDSAIMLDIAACIDARPAIMVSAEKEFEIDCPHGRWLGARRGIDFNDGREGCQSLAVRTFLTEVPALAG